MVPRNSIEATGAIQGPLLLLNYTETTTWVRSVSVPFFFGIALRGDRIKQDLRYTQKATYFGIFTNNVWSYLLRPPLIVSRSRYRQTVGAFVYAECLRNKQKQPTLRPLFVCSTSCFGNTNEKDTSAPRSRGFIGTHLCKDFLQDKCNYHRTRVHAPSCLRTSRPFLPVRGYV